MSETIFRQLQKKLDQYSMGFPETRSGIELKILQELFSEEDGALFLTMTPNLETAESVSSRLGKPVETVSAHLEDMSRRGLLFRLGEKGVPRYGAIPFVHGLFEFQVKDLKPQLARMVSEYFEERFDRSLQTGVEFFLRTIPVNRSVDVTHRVAAYEDAVSILRSQTTIVAADCICRKQRQIIDQSCNKPLEACFMFGSMGQYYLDRGMGRKLETDEAIALVLKCQEAGLVTQPATAQNPGGMCNCCGDCCGVLRALNRHPRPAELVFSNYVARLDSPLCIGCQTCLERCQMKALTMNDEGTAVLDPDRCIGCGLCVTTCPSGALGLEAKTGDRLRLPPATTLEQMKSLRRKRGLGR